MGEEEKKQYISNVDVEEGENDFIFKNDRLLTKIKIKNDSNHTFILSFLDKKFTLSKDSDIEINIGAEYYILQLDTHFTYNLLTKRFFYDAKKINKKFLELNNIKDGEEIELDKYEELHKKMTLKFNDLKVTGATNNIPLMFTFIYSYIYKI